MSDLVFECNGAEPCTIAARTDSRSCELFLFPASYPSLSVSIQRQSHARQYGLPERSSSSPLSSRRHAATRELDNCGSFLPLPLTPTPTHKPLAPPRQRGRT